MVGPPTSSSRCSAPSPAGARPIETPPAPRNPDIANLARPAPSWARASSGSASRPRLHPASRGHHYLTQDVAAIPFLWILPLSAYLLTFIICFESPRWYNRAVFVPLAAVQHHGPLRRLVPRSKGLALDMRLLIAFSNRRALRDAAWSATVSWFVSNLIPATSPAFTCRLSRWRGRRTLRRPARAQRVPRVLRIRLGLALCAFLACGVWQALQRWPASSRMQCRGLHRGGRRLHRQTRPGREQMVTGYRAVARNFYGQLRVIDEGVRIRTMPTASFSTAHQPRHADAEPEVPPSAGRLFLSAKRNRPRHALAARRAALGTSAFSGLGCGTLAAYGQAGDTFRLTKSIRWSSNSPEPISPISPTLPPKSKSSLGDGRLSLEPEPNQTVRHPGDGRVLRRFRPVTSSPARRSPCTSAT